jgi:uncharacterized protein
MTRIIPIAKAEDGRVLGIPLNLANRHGLVTGATGTGKTVTLQKMAEGFSAAGVPVFAADIKGDLSGIAADGDDAGRFANRARKLGEKWDSRKFPTRFWDLFGEDGMPIGTSVPELGPMLMARLLGLNDTQEGVFNVLLRWQEEQRVPVRDLEDVGAICREAFDYTEDLRQTYGHVTGASLGAIQRNILSLEAQNGWRLFREPALDISELMQCDEHGRGVINLVTADRLMENPRLYSTFLLFLLTRLFQILPEVGDLEKPKLVFFFDEAHLLFATATPKLMEAVERLVRLIRSKGVGVYFVTQSPKDVPDAVLAQLGNRVQHALRAFSPRDQKMIRAVAQTFRPNGKLDIAAAVTSLEVGECLISPMLEGGIPAPVERAMVLPPQAQVGPVSDLERQAINLADPLRAKYQDALGEPAGTEHFLARVHPRWLDDIKAARLVAEAAEEEEASEPETERVSFWGNPLAWWRQK